MGRPRKNPLPEEMNEQVVQSEIQEVPKVKKKGTPPGWKPAGQLPKLKAPPGFSPKWANPEKLDKLRAEGWIIMKPEDNKGQAILNMDVNDTGSLTGALRYREMIAVMLPSELRDARKEWVRNENREAVKSILKQTDEELTELGVQTYAPQGQSGRIIIE